MTTKIEKNLSEERKSSLSSYIHDRDSSLERFQDFEYTLGLNQPQKPEKIINPSPKMKISSNTKIEGPITLLETIEEKPIYVNKKPFKNAIIIKSYESPLKVQNKVESPRKT